MDFLIRSEWWSEDEKPPNVERAKVVESRRGGWCERERERGGGGGGGGGSGGRVSEAEGGTRL